MVRFICNASVTVMNKPRENGYRPIGSASAPSHVEGMRSSVQRAPIRCTDTTIPIAYEGGRLDAFSAVLKSAKTMTREMLIQWLEAEIAQL